MAKRNLLTLSTIAVAIVMISASAAEAQRGRGGGGFGGRGGGFGAGPAELLQREDVQAELKLTDGQIEELQEFAEASRNSLRDRFSGFNRGGSDEERQQAMARMREEMQKVQSEAREKVAEILNSKQKDRFSELEFQFQLTRGSAQAALEAGGVELSEKDREKLDEARQEIESKINQQIAEIRLNAQKEIMAAVVSESQIERMIGDAFEFEEQERRPRGAFGGNRWRWRASRRRSSTSTPSRSRRRIEQRRR